MSLISRLISHLLGIAVAGSANPAGAQSTSSKIPDIVAQVWLNPNAADAARRKVESGDAFYYDRPFVLTAEHIALLRRAHFLWDITESGAPMLNPRAPYGRSDLLAQLRETFAEADDAALAMRHVEMVAALRTLLRHGTLAPGRYTPGPKPARATGSVSTATELPANETGIAADGSFEFSEDHRALLKVLSVEWPNEYDIEDLNSEGAFPAPRGDGKRPYGDMSFYFLDMITALGLPRPERGPDDRIELAPELEAKLQALHFQILAAIQVFVENATISPGRYE